MTQAEKMARFAVNASFDDLKPQHVDRLKIHVLDTLGCALGALSGEPVMKVRKLVDRLGGALECTMIGGGRTSPTNAVLYNTSLTRYLDFMDNFMTEGETCHPCDNFASMLAAAEMSDASGKDLLTGLAVAYQIECRLSEVAPVMNAGLDHTYDLSYSIPAGAGRILGLDPNQIANALGIAGAYLGSIAVIRSSPGTELKGLAAAVTATGAMNALLMAMEDITGPIGVIENKKGIKEVLKVNIDVEWEKEPLNIIERCSLKSYNAEVHTQSTIDAVLGIVRERPLKSEEIDTVKVEVFRTAYEITGNGEYGNRYLVETKEQADHSLPYLVAVALLDGEVWPDQFVREQINRKDVQGLLKRVYVMVPVPEEDEQLIKQTDPFTEKYPKEVCARVTVRLKNGEEIVQERKEYPGFLSHPFSWEEAEAKFRCLATREVPVAIFEDVLSAVKELDAIQTKDLISILGRARAESPRGKAELR